MNNKDLKILERLTKKYGAMRLMNEAQATKKMSDNTPKVYVGTYGKYNDGDLSGEWVDLTDFSDKDEFIDYCMDLHNDEEYEPELMFQDWENIPDKFISESSIDEELWEYIELLEEYDADFIKDIMHECSLNDIDELREALDDMIVYHTDSTKTAVMMYVEEVGEEKNPEFCERYFDYEAFGRDIRLDGFIENEISDIYDEDEKAEREEELNNMSDYQLGEYFIDMVGGDITDAVGPGRMEYYIDYDAVERDFSYDFTFVETYLNGSPVVVFVRS